MNTRFVIIGGQKLAYYESAPVSEGSPALLFVHGNSISSSSFFRQMESPLLQKYRLIALDLPGHGLSAPAQDQHGYTMSSLVSLICEFTEKMDLKEAVFVGWSLGGNLLVEAMEQLPSAQGLMLIGTFLVSKPLDMQLMTFPHPVLGSLFKADLTKEEVDVWAAALMKPGEVPPSFLAEDIGRSDKNLRAALGAAIAQGEYEDEASIVGNLKIPLSVVLGSEDQLCRESYLRSLRMPSLWRGDIQVIPDAGHLTQWEQPDKFNGVLDSFITEVTM